MNFDISAKDKVIDGAMKNNGQVDGGLWYKGKAGDSLWTKYEPLKRKHTSPFEPRTSQINNDAPARDIVMKISGDQGRADEKGKIQMRHDATTNSWKVDFSYTGAQARGGSIVSAKTFADLLDQRIDTLSYNLVIGLFLVCFDKPLTSVVSLFLVPFI